MAKKVKPKKAEFVRFRLVLDMPVEAMPDPKAPIFSLMEPVAGTAKYVFTPDDECRRLVMAAALKAFKANGRIYEVHAELRSRK